jgi:hypothetical protein
MKKSGVILVLALFMVLLFSNTGALAKEYVWAAQGDVAYFEENGKIGLQL